MFRYYFVDDYSPVKYSNDPDPMQYYKTKPVEYYKPDPMQYYTPKPVEYNKPTPVQTNKPKPRRGLRDPYDPR